MTDAPPPGDAFGGEEFSGDGFDGELEPEPSRNSLTDMLMSTEPSPPLDTVDSPFDPERGGARRIMRGVMKATGVDGMPAIADVIVGAGEMMVQHSDGDGEPDQQPETGAEFDAEPSEDLPAGQTTDWGPTE